MNKTNSSIKMTDERKCPGRDGRAVEKYCVPNGTPGLACASVFYRYRIPNGMPRIFDSANETKTSFSPYLTNKTTSVVEMNTNPIRPNYLINTFKNEVIRLIIRGDMFSTEVVQLLKLGRNEVINVAFNKGLTDKRRRPFRDEISVEKQLTINH